MNHLGCKGWYGFRTLWRRGRGIVVFGLIACAGATPSGRVSPDMKDQPVGATPALVVNGVTVVDVEHGRLLPAQRIVIVGTRIHAMGPMTKVRAPQGAQIVDARGKYVIPGLWDMHIHTFRGRTDFSHQLLIANGVTSIRDAASQWSLDSLVAWRRQVLAGTRAGPPRQLLSGHSINQARVCVREVALHTCFLDSTDAEELIDSLKAAGADMLKLYRMPQQMYVIMAAQARRAGILFGGHVAFYEGGSTLPASHDSRDILLDHGWTLREFIQDCEIGRKKSQDVDYGVKARIEKCRPVAERLARNNTWIVPTWSYSSARPKGYARSGAIFQNFDQFVSELQTDSVAPASKHLQPYLQRGFATADTVPDTLRFGYAAKRAGLPILAGTDAGDPSLVAGYSIHLELAIYVVEGMTPLEALQTATLNPAKYLRWTDSLGTVAPGKVADLVLLDGNPLADITNTAAIRAVIANGRYLDRPTLDSLLTAAWVNFKSRKSR